MRLKTQDTLKSDPTNNNNGPTDKFYYRLYDIYGIALSPTNIIRLVPGAYCVIHNVRANMRLSNQLGRQIIILYSGDNTPFKAILAYFNNAHIKWCGEYGCDR